MSHNQLFAISAAGMDIERLRVDVAALNLANANVALDVAGNGYRPMRVVARTGSSSPAFPTSFRQWLLSPEVELHPKIVQTRQALDPGHPLADANGWVTFPAVDTTTEMMNMMSAMRAYEANVAAMNMGRAMAAKALEIGGA